MTEEELQETVQQLIDKTIQVDSLKKEILTLKAEIKEHLELQNINDWDCQGDNGYVELQTKTVYKLVDIPAESTIPEEITEKVNEDAFDTKVVLSKVGRELKKEQDPEIMKLMDASLRKTIKVNI